MMHKLIRLTVLVVVVVVVMVVVVSVWKHRLEWKMTSQELTPSAACKQSTGLVCSWFQVFFSQSLAIPVDDLSVFRCCASINVDSTSGASNGDGSDNGHRLMYSDHVASAVD